ncbi:MAG: hypothetical protein PHQ53_10775 [Candidatus Krumholzibacteria bacterium]|nr:hypothetical protein [Candidatus Krumholzibacteria bacterium]
MKWLAVAVCVVVAVVVAGCSEDDDWCEPPALVQSICSSPPSVDPCDCAKGPVDVTAYVDPRQLPRVDLIATTDYRGVLGVQLVCPDKEPPIFEIDEESLGGDGYTIPVIAKIRDAYLIAKYMPGNGMSFATWRLEFGDEDQVEFWIVQDGVEIPLER